MKLNKIFIYINALIDILKFKIHRLSNKPFASKTTYLNIHYQSKIKKYPVVEKFEKEHKFSIDNDWFEKLALYTQVVVKKSEINYQHGKLLYSLLMNYINLNIHKEKFIQIFETGTARGFSALCMAKAIIDSSIEGNITTVDILPHNKKMIWNCIDDCDGLKSRQEILSRWPEHTKIINFVQNKSSIATKNLSFNRIHFAFLDAHHITSEVINEFNFVESKQKSNDIIFFDDVTPALYPGVVDAINNILQSKKYSIKFLKLSEVRQYAVATKI